jgi:hypothetical protein
MYIKIIDFHVTLGFIFRSLWWELGLQQYYMRSDWFRVVDEKLFIMAVIKYGIKFERVDEYFV